jgi:hypothetical protein
LFLIPALDDDALRSQYGDVTVERIAFEHQPFSEPGAIEGNHVTRVID